MAIMETHLWKVICNYCAEFCAQCEYGADPMHRTTDSHFCCAYDTLEIP